MVQVIAAVPRGKSTTDRLFEALGQGAGLMANRLVGEHEQKKQRQAMEQAGFGDLAGLSPELQKVAVAERLRSQGKEKLLGQKQQMLSGLFGGQGQQDGMGRRLAQESQSQEMSDQQSPMPEGFDVSSIPDEAIAQASAIDPTLGNALRDLKDTALREKRAAQKHEFEKEKFEYGKTAEKEKMARRESAEITKPLMLELQQARKNIPLQEQAIDDIKNAVPDVGGLDYLADITGFEPLRTASGAKLKTAIKDFFLSDLSRTGSRPNQWIEQQLADALPKIGRSAEANLVVAEGMQFKVDLAKKRVELLDQLAEQDQAKFGYIKGDIDSRASKLLKPYVEQRKKDLFDDIHAIKAKNKKIEAEIKKGKYIRMISPEGETYEILPTDVKEAEASGFKFG